MKRADRQIARFRELGVHQPRTVSAVTDFATENEVWIESREAPFG